MSVTVNKATVSPSDCMEFLTTFIPTRRPIIIHSEPGLGKSQIVRQAAQAVFGKDAVIADVRAGQLDGAIVRGFPDMAPPVKGSKEPRTAHFAPLACWPSKGPGIIHLDELDKGEPEVQNALLELLLDRRLGEYRQPDDVFTVACANRLTDRAGSNRLNNALKSRCVHLHLVPSLDDWLAWATNHDVHPLVLAYVELKGAGMLHQFDPADTEADSFPCPRTWEMLSDCLKRNHSDKLLYHIVAGTIGANSTAGDFAAFARWYYKLPSKASVLSDPNGFALPTEGALRWALAVALVEWAKNGDLEESKNCIQAALRLTPELTTFALVHIISKRPDTFRLPPVMKWCASNQNLLNRRKVKVS